MKCVNCKSNSGLLASFIYASDGLSVTISKEYTFLKIKTQLSRAAGMASMSKI